MRAVSVLFCVRGSRKVCVSVLPLVTVQELLPEGVFASSMTNFVEIASDTREGSRSRAPFIFLYRMVVLTPTWIFPNHGDLIVMIEKKQRTPSPTVHPRSAACEQRHSQTTVMPVGSCNPQEPEIAGTAQLVMVPATSMLH